MFLFDYRFDKKYWDCHKHISTIGKAMSRCVFFILGLICHFQAFLFSASDYSIVFIHIGKEVPAYATVAFEQARDFNPDCHLILLANEEALVKISHLEEQLNMTLVPCESLVKSAEHERFIRESTLDRKWANGFWIYTSERFLYLQDLMRAYKLSHVFHMEYDNMLYANLGEMLPIFASNYPGVAGTFDNDERCIAGFIYISGVPVMDRLAKCFADCASEGRVSFNDQNMLARFSELYGKEAIDYLPIISREYVEKNVLRSQKGQAVEDEERFCQHIEEFQSVFDGAALGQFLGGRDPIHGPCLPGFINEQCVFNPSLLGYVWEADAQNRLVPYIVYKNKKFRINNLHVHSKQLDLFSSRS